MFTATARTSAEAYNTLDLTYEKSSRGHIMQKNKTKLRNFFKGSHFITKFMQFIKSKADEFALMNAPIDFEDLVIKVIHGVGDDYKELVHVIQARDIAISFE